MPEREKRSDGAMSAITMIMVVVLLAGGVGFWLYNPPRLASFVPSTLNVSGDNVEVQTLETITWKEAQDQMKLDPGSRVRTGTDSYALLTFAQDTTTKLDPGTDLLVARLEGNRDKPPDVIALRQWSGSTWNQIPAFLDDSRHFEIQTPSASAVGNGSSFSVNVDESGRTIVRAAEGQVDVRAQGREVQVTAGRQIEVKPGSPPSAPVPIPPGDVASAHLAGSAAKTMRPREAVTVKPAANQPDDISEWTLPPVNEWSPGHWIGVALLMVLLGTIFAVLSRWR